LAVAWNPGDHLTVRGGSWRVVQCTAHGDCSSLDLVSADGPAVSRTLLLPFDRPRRAPVPRLAVVSPGAWTEHVGARLARTFPFGGLRFCPRAIELLAYQLEPALAVFRHAATRVLIGDDVGLGKTVEAGVIVREVRGRKADARVLVIVPAALRTQWREELVSLLEQPSIDADAGWLRTVTRELPPDVNPWSIPGVYVSSVDFVKRPEVLGPLEALRWDLLVVDEAHGATPGTGRLAAVDALACRASVVLLLSATPHSGDRQQFEALCRIGSGPAHSPIIGFHRTRADLDAGQELRSRVIAVPPTGHERRMHRLLERYATLLWASARRGEANPALLATVFRKRALSSAGALALSLVRRLASLESPPRSETQPWLPLDPDAADVAGDEDANSVLGGKGLGDAAAERRTLEQCLHAAEAASAAESKTARLLHLLSRIQTPAIVFSEYRDTAMRLREHIAATGRRVVLLHGGLDPEERTSVTTEFSRGAAVMVATDAAAEGLNLHHACRLVIHYELPWAPGRLHQRCGRVNRIGQTRRVHEIVLVAADTAEQLVLQPLLRRLRESGTFTRGSLVHQLPEALVAARVFDGDRAESQTSVTPPGAEPFTTMDLRDEARAEAERLRTMRLVRPPGGGAGLVLPIAAEPVLRRRGEDGPGRRSLGEGWPGRRRRGRGCRITIVCSVAFRSGVGDMLEETLVPVTVEYSGRPWQRRRGALRAQVKRALAGLARHLDAVLDGVASARLAAIAAAHSHNASAHQARRRATSGQLTSAAAMLVQPCLFGRTALRTQRAPAPAWPDEAPVEDDAAREIGWRTGIEAVFCGSLT
jgi:superfamily II DNA or RNA helicase